MKVTMTVAVASLGLAACVQIPMQQEIFEASATGGDFTLLNCNQLVNAEGTVRQRIATPSEENGVYTFGVFTPDGERVAEKDDILTTRAQELQRLRDSRDCATTAKTGQTSAVETSQVDLAAVNPPPAPAPTLSAGRYLQVATLRSPENKADVVRKLRSRGVEANAQPVFLNGAEHHRIIIGPLRSREDIARADEAAASLGLNDGFFVSG